MCQTTPGSVVTILQVGKLRSKSVRPAILLATAGGRQVVSWFLLSTPKLKSGERSKEDLRMAHL